MHPREHHAPIAVTCLLILLTIVPATLFPGRTAAKNDAPAPIVFPRDEAPHAGPIEWWYYTGHLLTNAGDRYGFEEVFFRGRQGALTGYVGHFAITDGPKGSFHYDQRIVPAAGVSRGTDEFDLSVDTWRLAGKDGIDSVRGSMPGYAIDLSLTSQKPAVLHNGDGYVDYGNGTGSYYYSRTRMAVDGTIIVDGETHPVTGDAWMDHQWGNFSTFKDGGWDWFSMQLGNGTDLMLYLINDATGSPVIVNGTLIARDGAVTLLEKEDFSVRPTATWASPRTGIVYPSGWTVEIPEERLTVNLTPMIVDQELDTTDSTRVIYWEGEVSVQGRAGGQDVTGLGYVELTGYDRRTVQIEDGGQGTPVPEETGALHRQEG
jgi:predicted secreted hydrolase